MSNTWSTGMVTILWILTWLKTLLTYLQWLQKRTCIQFFNAINYHLTSNSKNTPLYFNQNNFQRPRAWILKKNLRLGQEEVKAGFFTKLKDSRLGIFREQFNPLSPNHTKWSNTIKQFVDCCQLKQFSGCWKRIVWVCLTILWGWHLKGWRMLHKL